jgi:SAM-dependent methyltransferase
MSLKADLYNSAYSNYGAEVYRQVRIDAYGEDLGQTSWVTTEESNEIPRALGLTRMAYVLEIGCGSGRYALQVAENANCRVLGVDISEAGIRNANELAATGNLSTRVHFEHCDVSKGIPFGDAIFDASFSNDVLCHIPGRLTVLRDIARVLKPGGRLVFSDALVIGGIISYQEIATRSSIGYYTFSPPGENERLVAQAGMCLLEVNDTTGNAAQIAKRWHDARDKRRDELIRVENNENFEGIQQFLSCAYTLAAERRLLRYLYVAQK